VPTETCVEHAKKFSVGGNPKRERILEELYRRTEIGARRSVIVGHGYGPQGDQVFKAPVDDSDRGPSTGNRMQYYVAEIGNLARQACEQAVGDANISLNQITHLVTVSCTGFFSPGFDIELIHALPLGLGTLRTHVGFMGCHGGMNGLRVAKSFVEADPNATVLLCAAEACSLHFQYGWSTNKLVANSLFADGAAAAVISNSPASQQAKTGRWALLSSSSFIVPDSLDSMLWQIGDNGFEMQLSNRVPPLIEQWLPDWLDSWLQQLGLDRTKICSWAVHPGGPRILDSVEACLKLDSSYMAPARQILASCGNMSSPTIFFILDSLRANGKSGLCVMLGFGPGLTIEAALIDLAP